MFHAVFTAHVARETKIKIHAVHAFVSETLDTVQPAAVTDNGRMTYSLREREREREKSIIIQVIIKLISVSCTLYIYPLTSWCIIIKEEIILPINPTPIITP